MPDLPAFNSAHPDDLRPLLTECLAVPRWVDAVLAGRPYEDVGALLAAADRAAGDLSDDEVRAAIAGHPRIGERAAGDGPGARWSADEQSGVAASAAGELAAGELAAANAAYEERFGHIYLVRAAGLSGRQVLADLAARLDNPPEVELRVVNRELAGIAALRLGKVLS